MGNKEEVYLVANIAQCRLCRDIIQSDHVHHFVTCGCGSISVDGGLDYLKRSGTLGQIQELSVYSDAGWEVIRNHFKRGCRGKDGTEPLHYIRLKDMTDEHLYNTIEYVSGWVEVGGRFRDFYYRERHYRDKYKIKVEDT